MARYRKGSHTSYELHYHFVFITKYRKPILRGEVARRLRDLIRQICDAHDAQIVRGHVRPDHVHLMLSLPPSLAPSRIMQAVKGKASHELQAEYRGLKKAFWGRHLWARGYFVCTTGNVTDAVIKQYIEMQGAAPQNDDADFRVSE